MIETEETGVELYKILLFEGTSTIFATSAATLADEIRTRDLS